ncbi:hypothetical protein GGF43_001342 [Coemansia sp. RSA 2618]|nr:hypothetical protein GGF43_001342 [Coemansia sp. RSA 2618]
MAELIPNKLKVTELREELAKRNLSTAGLKKDLVERLERELGVAGGGISADKEEDDQIDLLPTDEQEGVDMDAELHGDMGVDAMNDGEHDGLSTENMEAESYAEDEGDRKRKLSESAGQASADMHMDTDEAHSGAGNGQVGGSTDSLFIKNLERPLTLFRIKELLGQYGTIDDVWLNSIKTRAYVSFSTTEEAEAAHKGTNGVQFPPEHGKILESGFITRERMRGLIGDEELKSGEVHSIDLVVVPEESGNCGIALISASGKGKAASKRQKTESKRQADTAANQPVSLVIAAASASAKEANAMAKDRKDGKQAGAADASNGTSAPAASEMDDGLTRRTKTSPVLTFRPLTDAEVAAKKAARLA